MTYDLRADPPPPRPPRKWWDFPWLPLVYLLGLSVLLVRGCVTCVKDHARLGGWRPTTTSSPALPAEEREGVYSDSL